MADRSNARLATLPVLPVTVALATAGGVVTVRQMHGMDMGVATGLGSFGFFAGVWFAMTSAMMLPGAVPAIGRYARSAGAARALVRFLPAYLGVWCVVGLAAYALYEPHDATSAGAVTIAAGLYELTPLKRRARRECLETPRSGAWFGLACVGSNAGLMAVLLAVGAMSVAWMCVIGAVMLAQKLVPPMLPADVALALALALFGVLIVLSPASVPGLTPTM